MKKMMWLLAVSLPSVVACGPRTTASAPVDVLGRDAAEPTPVYEAPAPVASPPDLEITHDVVEPAAVTSVEDVGEPTVTYHLRRGETLDHFARWADLPVEILADTSGLPLTEPLAVGTLVRVPADSDRRSRIEVRRDAHHERRAEGYLASRGGSVGTEFHVVRTGQTAWAIAKENGDLPVWLLETFNPSLDLDYLKPGQAVMLPVTADMVDAVSMVDEDAP